MARKLAPNPLVDRPLSERKFAGKRDKPIDEAHGGGSKKRPKRKTAERVLEKFLRGHF
jgi:hypothetical protein